MSNPDLGPLEHCIGLCEKLLLQSGVEVMANEKPGVLHGRVMLTIFDFEAALYRPYARATGDAEFRSFCRSRGPDIAPRIEELLTEFRELAPFIRRYWDLPSFSPPLVSEPMIRQLFLGNNMAWPDELYLKTRLTLADLERALDINPHRPDFIDMRKKWPEFVSPVDAVRQAVDLVCAGTWVGVSIEKINEMLRKLIIALQSGAKSVPSPLALCLEPGEAWQLRLPLVCDGVQGNLIISVGGGDLSLLKGDHGELVSDLRKTADIMASHLAKERFAAALSSLTQNNPQGEDPERLKLLALAVRHIIGPHTLLSLSVDDCIAIDHASDMAARGRNVLPLAKGERFEVMRKGHRLEAHIALSKSARIIKPEIENLSVAERLSAIFDAYLREMPGGLEAGAGDDASHGDPYEAAAALLARHKGAKVSRKDFASCLVAYGMLEKRGQAKFQISGNTNRVYQQRLEKDWDIHRRKASESSRKSTGANTVGDAEKHLAVAQLFPGDQDLRETEARIGGVKLEKERGCLRVAVFQPPFDRAKPGGTTRPPHVPPYNGSGRPAA